MTPKSIFLEEAVVRTKMSPSRVHITGLLLLWAPIGSLYFLALLYETTRIEVFSALCQVTFFGLVVFSPILFVVSLIVAAMTIVGPKRFSSRRIAVFFSMWLGTAVAHAYYAYDIYRWLAFWGTMRQ